ncbi:MAG: hypothetical protein ACYC5N_02000, partial [Endomicrobiales bacterium]
GPLLFPRSCRFLAGAIFFCFILNGFVPRFSFQVNDYSAVSRALAGESLLFQYLSFSSLPLKIVGSLMSESGVLPSSGQKKAPEQEQRKSEDTSTDYSLAGSDNRTNAGRCVYSPRLPGPALPAAGATRAAVSAASKTSASPPSGESHALFLAVLFFFLLPRSSLSEEAAGIFFRKGDSTRFEFSSRVFYCPVHPMYA